MKVIRFLAALILGSGTLALSPVRAAPVDPVDYQRDVKPIIRERCYACHGALRQKSGLRLDSAALIRKGGQGGPLIAAGKSPESPLGDAVLGRGRSRMPPTKDGPPLTDKQIAILKT